MNKSELVKELSEKTNTTRHAAASFLKELSLIVEREVITNGEFTLVDVCKLKTHERAETNRRNPITGETFLSPAKKVVKITAAKKLRDALI